jgi:hypothetical protein
MQAQWLGELIGQLAAEDGLTRQRARETLVAIGEPALPSLVELLGSSQPRLRWEAAKALTQIPEPAAIANLILLLSDARSEIGWLAGVGLINMGSRSVPYVLQALTERAESRRFRSSSHHVLHDLSGRNVVLHEILEPVLEVLDVLAPDAGVISSRAEVALHTLRALSGG